MAAGDSVRAFYAARGFLFAHRDDYDTAYRDFRWPELDTFNWALDHFDAVAADPVRGRRRALWIVEQDGSEAHWTFAELAARSNQVANRLREWGVRRGDRVVLMLGNQVELWETLLAAMKLGAVVIPATTQLRAADVRDRLDRGGARHVVVAASATGAFEDVRGRLHADRGRRRARRVAGLRHDRRGLVRLHPGRRHPRRTTRCCSTSPPAPRRARSSSSTPTRRTRSGTCRRCTGSGWSPATSTSTSPRRAGRSTRGATCSPRGCAEACVLVMNYARFDARVVLDVLDRCAVTSFCAPPTVWRMLIQADLTRPATAADEGGRGGRAAQPRGHRAGRAGVGRADPRRVRPDRDDGADRATRRASR